MHRSFKRRGSVRGRRQRKRRLSSVGDSSQKKHQSSLSTRGKHDSLLSTRGKQNSAFIPAFRNIIQCQHRHFSLPLKWKYANLLDTLHPPSPNGGCWDTNADARYPESSAPDWSPGRCSRLHLHVWPWVSGQTNIIVFVSLKVWVKRRRLFITDRDEWMTFISPWSCCRPGWTSQNPSAAPGWSAALPDDWRCCHNVQCLHPGLLHCCLVPRIWKERQLTLTKPKERTEKTNCDFSYFGLN